MYIESTRYLEAVSCDPYVSLTARHASFGTPKHVCVSLFLFCFSIINPVFSSKIISRSATKHFFSQQNLFLKVRLNCFKFIFRERENWGQGLLTIATVTVGKKYFVGDTSTSLEQKQSSCDVSVSCEGYNSYATKMSRRKEQRRCA